MYKYKQPLDSRNTGRELYRDWQDFITRTSCMDGPVGQMHNIPKESCQDIPLVPNLDGSI